MKRKFVPLSIVAFVAGISFLLASKVTVTGAVIGTTPLYPAFTPLLGIAFIIISLLLLISGESLEEKLKAKWAILEKRLKVNQAIVQQREDGYYLCSRDTKECYTLPDVEELSRDEELKTALRKQYFSDLLRLYARAPKLEKEKYRLFIKALSPHTKDLAKRLKQFENAYERIKDKAESLNPARLKDAKPTNFSAKVYVRFENEIDTLWPEAGTVGFLPFDEVKVNPRRGPRFSAIPLSTLVQDGYLVDEGKTLNPRWSRQERKDYLRDTYGMDVGAGQRNMVFFQIENDAEIEPYGNYVNFIIKDKIPLVKVATKK